MSEYFAGGDGQKITAPTSLRREGTSTSPCAGALGRRPSARPEQLLSPQGISQGRSGNYMDASRENIHWGHRAQLICWPKTCVAAVTTVLAAQNSLRNSFLVVKSSSALRHDLPVRASAAQTGNGQLCHHFNQLKYFNQSLISMEKHGVQLRSGAWVRGGLAARSAISEAPLCLVRAPRWWLVPAVLGTTSVRTKPMKEIGCVCNFFCFPPSRAGICTSRNT